jgi:hypothetical protein
MDLYLLLVSIIGLCLVFQLWVEREPRHQVMTLKAGETLLGVLDRGRGHYIFVGNDPRRSYAEITPDEVKLLKQLLDAEDVP